MIDNAGNLLVFEDFRIDRSLPKFVESPKSGAYVTPGDFSITVGDESMYSMNPDSMGRLQSVVHGGTVQDAGKPSLFMRVVHWIMRVLLFKKEKPTITVEQFFLAVKGSTKNIEIVKERADGYMREVIRARQAGQKALAERLVDGMNAYRMETHLLAMGLPKFLEEEDLIQFYKQSKRGLRLDWVKNFVRRIPDEILEAKTKADEAGIFDNYAVLHYDPGTKAYSETKEEIARRKDPILFGLMRGRRRLYVVGDWVDDYCDLTLDQIADAIGKESVKDLSNDKP